MKILNSLSQKCLAYAEGKVTTMFLIALGYCFRLLTQVLSSLWGLSFANLEIYP